jgi:hypothetical protein
VERERTISWRSGACETAHLWKSEPRIESDSLA